MTENPTNASDKKVRFQEINETPDADIRPDDGAPSSIVRRDILKAGSAAALTAGFVAATRDAQAQALYTPDPPAEVPDWYNTPSEQLTPGKRTSDYYVPDYTSGKNSEIDWWFGRNVAGVTIGLIQARAYLPMAPGNMGNATTFDFPMLYREAVPPNVYDILADEPTESFTAEMVKAAKWLELQGVRAIMANCGFYGTYQKAIAEQIETPLYSTSLLQLPAMLASLPERYKIGVITANGETLAKAPAIENCGVTPQQKAERIVIRGLEDGTEMQKILNLTGNYNMLALEEEIVEGARSLVAENPDIRSILLECTELPPAAYKVQDAVRMPVWDYTTLTKWVYDGTLRKPFLGIM